MLVFRNTYKGWTDNPLGMTTEELDAEQAATNQLGANSLAADVDHLHFASPDTSDGFTFGPVESFTGFDEQGIFYFREIPSEHAAEGDLPFTEQSTLFQVPPEVETAHPSYQLLFILQAVNDAGLQST